ncbi:MAG: protein kinase domain-containing protein [Ktedonobacteraceae bacterium]
MGATSVFCIDCGAANPLHAKFCFACGESVNGPDQALHATYMTMQIKTFKVANAATELLKPGEVLKQRYKILSLIGQGGFGAVYKAEDKELGQRLLAVKEMSQQHLSQQEIEAGVEAFKHEALLLAGLRHEHLPHIYDHFAENERWYLVMDYIEGETLEAHFEKSRDGSLPLVMALKVALQLCEVLDYLHTRQPPIIFRDLKPANVILTPPGDLFLIDFGIARHFKPGQAKDTIAFGSPGYAAPEQYGKAQTTPRADIYSLGAILHQMVSGADPSLSPFRFAALTAHDPALDQLVKGMLDMDEAQRPTNIAKVQQTLRYIQAHPATHARVSRRAGQVMPAPPSAFYLSARPPLVQRVPIVVHTHHYGVVHTVAWSPDSQYSASATEAIIRVWDAHTHQNICSYREHIGEIKHMAWSPSAMRIASLSEENKVRVWDAHTSKIITTYPADPGLKRNVAQTLAWSSNGRLLAVGGSKYLHIWDTQTGQIFTKLRGRLSTPWSSLAWSPDTYVFAAAQGNRVMVCALDAWPNTHYYRNTSPINTIAWSPNGIYLACGSVDQTIRVWNVRTHQLVGIYRDHTHSISTLSWSPDSQQIASSSFSTTINVWNARTGLSLAAYHAHSGSVLSVAWSPDGHSILSGGSDRRVCIWQAP